MAFPTLFPHGRGDPTNKRRLREVTLTEGFKHLIRYAEHFSTGQFVWRFASHPRFPYWALNMKQRHQLLSQARVYLTQNPQDANLTTEELQEMVRQMSAQQLMNRVQRYVAKIQGTRQYWYQRYLELKALIEQKGAPTFFFTFSAADNYWPDLHRLLEEPNNATPAIQIKAVINHPHITDSHFVARLEEFNKHWVDQVLCAEWKLLRYEWQARGSIHAHGCAKLKNDPGLCELVKKAAQGWKLKQILDRQHEESNYQDMVNEFTPAIEAGIEAKARVIQYADWLLTTMNEALPDGNWAVPNPHPSAIPIQETGNENDDYHSLVNSVERHTRCSTAYCLRSKHGQQPQCRFNYPKDCTEQTSIDFELIVKGDNGGQDELTVQQITEARVRASLITKRNDDRINSHNRLMLQNWRANVDLQAIVDTDQCIRYMAKYATKGEPRSQQATEILQSAINKLRHTGSASSALRRAMIQVAGERDIGSQETAHMLLGKSLYSCTYSFLCISLDGSQRVRGGQGEEVNHGDSALDPSLRDHYASRVQWREQVPGIMQLNLLQFASDFYITKGDKRKRKQEVIIRTFPVFSPNPSGKNYGKYCKFQLVKYKPWHQSVDSAWDGLEESDKVFIECYKNFLHSETGQQCIPTFAQELEQAMVHHVNTENDGDENDGEDDENMMHQQQEEVEEWMLICRFNEDFSNSTANDVAPDFDWTSASRNMPPDLLRESEKWIAKQRNEVREAANIQEMERQPVDLTALNHRQNLAYSIVQQHKRRLNENVPTEPLDMIITGTAGTGKSFLINALAHLLGDQCILTGTTGIAGFNIAGSTLHSTLQLPVRTLNKTDLKGAALQRLQLRLQGKHYLIIDEFSMLGQRTLAWVDKRLRQASGKLNTPLEGYLVILFGDFAQLPPVGDRPLYSPPAATVLAQQGYSVYTLFENVVVLNENVRQNGNNPEAEEFRELLLRMRDGIVTEEDWHKLQERAPQNVNMEDFKDAVRLFYDKENVARYNYEKLCRLGNPIARISGVHSGVPVPPHRFEWEDDNKKLSRLQFPLRLSYAMTIHKSQGQTLNKVVIDIGKSERAAGCTFVATSRVRSLQHAVIQPMPFQRLQGIGKCKRLQERLTEEQRLLDLADNTSRIYQHF